MLPGNLLHPLKLDVVGFKEEDHDYHFLVDLPEPTCCQSCGAVGGRIVKFGKDYQAYRDVPIHSKRVTIWMIRPKPKPRRQSPFEGIGRMTYSMATDFDFEDAPADYGVPISTVMRLLESGEI